MNHLIKNFNLFLESFADRLNDDGWVEFGSTYAGGDPLFNSSDHFREGRRRIYPDKRILEEVISIVKDNLGDKIVILKWMEEYKQLYCYMWSNKTHMNYREWQESNQKLLIVDFYEDSWIMCSIVNENGSFVGRSEKHYVCDDIFGFNNFIKAKKLFLTKKDEI